VLFRSAQHYTETAIDEIKLLEKCVSANPENPGKEHIVQLVDWFKHHGPHGSHICMAFEVLGPNLLTLIRQNQHKGIQIGIVKRIAKQVLLGLDYLHTDARIIHTDLKPENVLVCIDLASTLDKIMRERSVSPKKSEPESGVSTPTGSPKTLTRKQKKRQKYKAKKKEAESLGKAPGGADSDETIADHESLGRNLSDISLADKEKMQHEGEGIFHHHPEQKAAHISRSVLDLKESYKYSGTATSPVISTSVPMIAEEVDQQTRSPTKPRSLFGKMDSDTRVKIADLGNACWIEKHFSNDIQTRQYRSPEAIIGAPYETSADMWSFGCMIFELLTGDYLFDPKCGSRYTKDDDHIAQIIELVGVFPRHVALSGKYSIEIFNRKGELRNIHKLRYWKLEDVFVEKYQFEKREARAVAEFILPCLAVCGERRISARALLENSWLDGV